MEPTRKQVNTFCDRRLDPILADGSALTAEAGNLRKRRGPISIDLYSGCTDVFVNWLDGNPNEAPSGLVPTEDAGAIVTRTA
ncbi:hypothetical protein [Paludisphaera soli]|uniref:hypothetical protein n=1 Tax=Paludisphaera soli TaxID=2712865 RepID=UPI0013EA6047|nr:hypothetical protein [Paludisphaera soli]